MCLNNNLPGVKYTTRPTETDMFFVKNTLVQFIFRCFHARCANLTQIRPSANTSLRRRHRDRSISPEVKIGSYLIAIDEEGLCKRSQQGTNNAFPKIQTVGERQS